MGTPKLKRRRASPDDPELARFMRDELGVDMAPASAGSWQVTAPVWIWRGNARDGTPTKASWYFLTIDGDVADAIRVAAAGRTGGFGSVRVAATIGATSWQTSLFTTKELGGYQLPLKATVRRAEGLEADVVASVTLALG